MNLVCSCSFLVIGHSPFCRCTLRCPGLFVLSRLPVCLLKKKCLLGRGRHSASNNQSCKHTFRQEGCCTRIAPSVASNIYGPDISVLSDLSVHKMTTFKFNIGIESIRLFAVDSIFYCSISNRMDSVKASTVTFNIYFYCTPDASVSRDSISN